MSRSAAPLSTYPRATPASRGDLASAPPHKRAGTNRAPRGTDWRLTRPKRCRLETPCVSRTNALQIFAEPAICRDFAFAVRLSACYKRPRATQWDASRVALGETSERETTNPSGLRFRRRSRLRAALGGDAREHGRK